MSLAGRKLFRLVAVLGAGHLVSAALLAQSVTNYPPEAPSNAAAVRRVNSGPPLPPEPLPPLPTNRSPITFFRELLAMTAAELNRALTNRSPQSRALIMAKVKEYRSLNPDECELRLRATELHWYLLPLMNTPATNRAAQLALIPAKDRKLVEDRLQVWDMLTPDMQQDLLASEDTIRYLAEIQGLTTEQRRQVLATLSPARRAVLEQGIAKWSALSDEERQQMLQQFQQFFELTPQERQKALNTLSGPERRQIEKTLRSFGNLPPEQRDECIRSFAKFTGLSLAEREQFLKSAERWKQLTPAERQKWRDLVHNLPRRWPVDLPPLPDVPNQSQAAQAAATN